jgi:hypothetical protein
LHYLRREISSIIDDLPSGKNVDTTEEEEATRRPKSAGEQEIYRNVCFFN